MDNSVESRHGESSMTLILPHSVLAGNIQGKKNKLGCLKSEMGRKEEDHLDKDKKTTHTFQQSLGRC